MSNFDNLKHYILPSDLLLDMLNTYKHIGKNTIYESTLQKNIKLIEEATIERDVFFLASLLNYSISDNRLRLLITKNSKPRTSEEQVITNLKDVVSSIHKNAKKHPFNSSDLLSYINTIHGPKYAKFSASIVKGNRKKHINDKSLRLLINNVLDDYYVYFTKELYEKVFLSLITYIEFVNINPFTKANDLAGYLMLYYMTLRCDIDCFRYISFFEVLYTNIEHFNREVAGSSMNYKEGFIPIFGLARLFYSLIDQGYQKLAKICKEYTYEENVNKSANVENTIRMLPDIFTKEDIRRRHPFVSEATINRILVKLRDEEFIVPLGKGRSAKWMKTHKQNIDYKNMVFDEEDDDLPF